MVTLTDCPSNVKEKYRILEILGSGSFGTVRSAKNRETGEMVAIKTIDKDRVDDTQMLTREIELLRQVHHPHIIQLYDIYEDELSIHLVTELCTGGELYDKVVEKAESFEGHFSEEDAALLVWDILDAIRYCHDELNIVHRDLKPENFLLKDSTDPPVVKIIDFGLSRKNDAPFGLMSSRVGTPYYVAPEVLSDSYTYKCDIWSIGVICYLLLCGFAPFAGDDDIETMRLVRTAPLCFPSPEWDDISDQAKDFCATLLEREAFQRPKAAEALKHPWLQKYCAALVEEPVVATTSLTTSVSTTSTTSTTTEGDLAIHHANIPPPRPFAKLDPKSWSEPIHSDHSGGTPHLSRLDSRRRHAFSKFLMVQRLAKAMKSAANHLSPLEMNELGQVLHEVTQTDDKDGENDIVEWKDLDDRIVKSSTRRKSGGNHHGTNDSTRSGWTPNVQSTLDEVRRQWSKSSVKGISPKPVVRKIGQYLEGLQEHMGVPGSSASSLESASGAAPTTMTMSRTGDDSPSARRVKKR